MGSRFSGIQYEQIKEQKISGRYLTLDCIDPIIKTLGPRFKINVEGFSEENRPLYSVTYGSGSFKVLMWSQMHGNESTTTKAIFDFLNFLNVDENLDSKITFKILPMLNPDGALRYTRENANGVDLNRDALNRSQSEIKTLFTVFEGFKPDLCLNMHDQRSIFSAGNTASPAVVSFLAPSADSSKSITKSREYAMQLIVAMNNHLQKYIPGNVGRYSDDFNPNCLGDTFQSMGVPTILFEAGHMGNDYRREIVRRHIFSALLGLFGTIAGNENKLPDVAGYFNIPENEKLFFDIIIRNIKMDENLTDVAVQFEERPVGNDIDFIPKVAKIGELGPFFGHKMIDAGNKEIAINGKRNFSLGSEINRLMIDGKNVSMI